MDRPFYGSVQVCFDCKNRQIGCHADCEIYQDAKRESEERKKKAQEKRRDEFIGYSNNKARQKEAIRRWYKNYGV